jgi:hypothetical protein
MPLNVTFAKKLSLKNQAWIDILDQFMRRRTPLNVPFAKKLLIANLT